MAWVTGVALVARGSVESAQDGAAVTRFGDIAQARCA